MGHLSVLKFVMSGSANLSPRWPNSSRAGLVPRECLDLSTSARRYITYFEATGIATREIIMTARITAWVVIALLLIWPGLSTAQTLPVLNLGFSGSGIGADLLNVTERANLWRKHGVDVRPIYLTSGTLMAQTLSAGDIGL